MSQPATGEDVHLTRAVKKARAAGWTWNNCRCGIVAKTPTVGGKHETTIWYGEHVVTWSMYVTRPGEW